MAGGLTARQISELLKEHGSYDAAIAARPDLVGDLRSAQRIAEQWVRQLKPVTDAITRQVENLRAPRLSLLGRPTKPPSHEGMAKAKFERDVHVFEMALARHARSEAKKLMKKAAERPELSEKQKLLYKHYPNATFAKVLALLDQREKVSAIARATKLKRQDVDKIKLWRDGGVYDAMAGQFPNTVILVRRSRTA